MLQAPTSTPPISQTFTSGKGSIYRIWTSCSGVWLGDAAAWQAPPRDKVVRTSVNVIRELLVGNSMCQYHLSILLCKELTRIRQYHVVVVVVVCNIIDDGVSGVRHGAVLAYIVHLGLVTHNWCGIIWWCTFEDCRWKAGWLGAYCRNFVRSVSQCHMPLLVLLSVSHQVIQWLFCWH